MWSELPIDLARDGGARAGAWQESLAVAAREFLSRGWPVIPLFGKVPAIPSWREFQSRLPTTSEVESWFCEGKQSPSGIGIVTGKLAGLVVVDCDSMDDAAFWQEHFPSSPLVVATGGGGVHFYYAMPEGEEVRNRAGVLGRKIDVRGEGGYATAPPSLHPSGKLYAWQAYNASTTLPTIDAAWLVDKSKPARLPLNEQTGKVRNAVAYIRRIRATAGEGGHNATFRAACKLRDAGISEGEALAVLSDWNETNASPCWSAADLVHKIRSAFDSLTR
ncbi:MAG: bifunctional DNA primase/polymerase [Pirellulales bacterium]|nr:bifunctional DNA primase/polymerase [Pirellulales bacterium]